MRITRKPTQNEARMAVTLAHRTLNQAMWSNNMDAAAQAALQLTTALTALHDANRAVFATMATILVHRYEEGRIDGGEYDREMANLLANANGVTA